MSRLRWPPFWGRLLCMAFAFCVLSLPLLAETPLGPPDWKSELESLKRLLLSQIA